MRSIYIKQGPVVFLKDVIFMESVAVLLMFLASFAENYEMLYRGFSLDDYFRYDLFIIVAASLFQFLYLIALFLNWYFSYVEIKDKEINIKSGFLFSLRKKIMMSDIVSIDTYQSPIDRIMNHATIILEKNNGKQVKIYNIPQYEDHIDYLRYRINAIIDVKKNDLQTLVAQGEGVSIEFKQSLRFDYRTNTVNKDLEKVVLKSIAGFLNSEGGYLVIGVDDSGKVCGIENDFKSLPKNNKDAFENHLTMLIRNNIGINHKQNIDIYFEDLESKTVCIVFVRKSKSPVFIEYKDSKEEFFVRVGNSTQPFLMSEAQDYIKSHF